MEKIRYHKDISVDEDGIYLINDFRYLDIPTEHIRYYGEYKSLLKDLSGKEKNILFFLLEEMNVENIVRTDVKTLHAFNEEYGVSLTNSAFKNSISKLKNNKVLLQHVKGYSYVNPIYFFKGYSKDRVKLIKYLLSDTKEFISPFTENDLLI